jgi:hypothetical protein
MTLQETVAVEINKIDTSNLSAQYHLNGYKIFFDAKEWEWKAVNQFGFGSDSDGDVTSLLKRISVKF